jgi:hypothetical protein
MLSLSKPDWALTGDPGLTRVSGGLIVGSPFKLKIPIDAMPVTAGPPSVLMTPALTSFFGTQISCDLWTKIGQFTAPGANFKFWQLVRKHIFLVQANVDTAVLSWILMRVNDPNPPVLLGTGIITALFNDVIGMRVRCKDDVGGIKVQAAVNVNEGGWLDVYNAIDVGAAPFIGVPGGWILAFDLQGALGMLGDVAYIDNFVADAIAPV